MTKRLLCRTLRCWSALAERVVLMLIGFMIVYALFRNITGLGESIHSVLWAAFGYSMGMSIVFLLTNPGTGLYQQMAVNVSFGAGRRETILGLEWYTLLYIVQMAAVDILLLAAADVPLRMGFALCAGASLFASGIGFIGLGIRISCGRKPFLVYTMAVGLLFVGAFVAMILIVTGGGSFGRGFGRVALAALFQSPKGRLRMLMVGLLFHLIGFFFARGATKKYAVEL